VNRAEVIARIKAVSEETYNDLKSFSEVLGAKASDEDLLAFCEDLEEARADLGDLRHEVDEWRAHIDVPQQKAEHAQEK